jgi:excisionase family DNA binding protein
MAADDLAVMTAKEVAAYLRISKQIVYRLIRFRKLPAFRIGAGPRDWRFYRVDVERFAQGGTEGRGPPSLLDIVGGRLICDVCGAESEPSLTPESIREKAVQKGWVSGSAARDLCPNCRSKDP